MLANYIELSMFLDWRHYAKKVSKEEEWEYSSVMKAWQVFKKEFAASYQLETLHGLVDCNVGVFGPSLCSLAHAMIKCREVMNEHCSEFTLGQLTCGLKDHFKAKHPDFDYKPSVPENVSFDWSGVFILQSK